MLIYIRHGDDRNDDVYRHDRRLTKRGREKATSPGKFGFFDHVVMC